VIYFQIVFLEEAATFITTLDKKTAKKLTYNIWRARESLDSRLFKKLTDEIWEFRVRSAFWQVRLLAFWDKTKSGETLVIATHGFIKKTDKIPGHEIQRAMNIRKRYFETKE
jgi:phage-related protein